MGVWSGGFGPWCLPSLHGNLVVADWGRASSSFLHVLDSAVLGLVVSPLFLFF